MHQMEYKGLNLLDEVCTVEIAIDEETQTVHILDTNHVIEPTYYFTKKAYEFSEGFEQFITVLRSKPYFVQYASLSKKEWIDAIQWLFYSSNQTVKQYNKQQWHIYPTTELPQQSIFYDPYVKRLKK